MFNGKSKKEFTYIWEIENFSACTLRNNECLDSPTFVAEVFGKCLWNLVLYPRGYGKTRENYISCFLQQINALENDTCIVNFEITLLSTNGEIFESPRTEYAFSSKNTNYGKNIITLTENVLSALKNACNDTLTVSCHMMKIEANSQHVSGCVARTKICKNHCFFQWNFRVPKVESWLDIREFLFPNICTIIISLTLRNDKIDILICLKHKNELYKSFSCKTALLDVACVERYSKTDTRVIESDEEEWRFPSFIKKSQLQNEKDALLKNDFFTLNFYFSVPGGENYNEIVKYTYESSNKIKNSANVTLRDDLRNMLNNKICSDVQLLVDSETFHAHRSLLSARSSVFCAMFEREMLEKKTGIVEISDVTADTMKHFLDFLYTDSVDDMNYSLAVRLLAAANKYQVTRLIEKCSLYLESVLSVENACQILSTADMVRDETLKTSAINYVARNSGEILVSPNWMELTQENCKLGSEVLQKISMALGSAIKNKVIK